MRENGHRPPSYRPRAAAHRLERALAAREPGGRRLWVVEREPNLYESTHRSEIVTCRTTDGRRLRLFVKRQRGERAASHGHRGGLAYEARVYADVLASLGIDEPVFHGAHHDGVRGEWWLFVEELDGVDFLYRAPPRMLLEAAAWIGRFQAASTGLLVSGGARFLTRYDAAYYRGWATRTLRLRAGARARVPWLEPLCERFAACAERLAGAAPTIIHGEYYPMNILAGEDRVYPIDWESAAVGAGEIDLAMLTQGWGEDLERRCLEAYRRARWRDGPPPGGFPDLVDDAAVYVQLRWLGDASQGADDEVFADLRRVAARLGLLPPAVRPA